MHSHARLEKVFDKTMSSKLVHEGICFIENGAGDFTFSKGYGGKELETPFLMASVTKLFTTTCIVKLLEASKIKLEDKIAQYFEAETLKGIHAFRGKDYSDQITVEDLLFQKSGLPDWFLDGAGSYARRMVKEDFSFTFEEVLAATKQLNPKFPPSSPKKAYYTDINFDLLGSIIEQVSGLSLSEAYGKFIIEPLELKNTYLADQDSTDLPAVYYKGSRLKRDNFIKSIGASGGGITNALDLMAFIKAFWSGKLFAQAVFEILKPFNRLQLSFYPICYAGGYMRMEASYPFKPKVELLGHSGSTGSFAFYAPQLDLFFVGDVSQFASQAIPIRLVMRLALASN